MHEGGSVVVLEQNKTFDRIANSHASAVTQSHAHAINVTPKSIFLHSQSVNFLLMTS